MKKQIHLAFCCLLSSMFFQANAMQQNDTLIGQDAERELAALSALTHDDDAAETRRSCGSRSSKSKCGGCQPKDNCCTKLQCREIISTLNVVESKVCLLTECEPIPLSQSDVVDGFLTIDNPGLYSLCQNITATVNIAASQVTLDLNCHQVTGEVSIPENAYEDIMLTNGIIDGNNSHPNGVNIGRGTDNVELSHLTIKQATSNGIVTTQDTSNLVISNALIEGCGGSALQLAAVQNVLVTDSIFFNNGNGLVSSSGNNNIVFRNCHAINNTGVGFNTNNAGRQIYFFNCSARRNSAGGFRSHFTAFNCIAEGNGGFGFRLTADDNLSRPSYLQNCIAQNNTSGAGFLISADSTGTISQCLALNNTGNGFQHTAGSTVQYVSNYAQDNTGDNYNPTMGPPFNPFSSTAAGISFWYNTRPA